jgi:hypothetical protein
VHWILSFIYECGNLRWDQLVHTDAFKYIIYGDGGSSGSHKYGGGGGKV